jgi:formylglycine-generating enzyme required for sulfatase activity
MIGLGRPGWHSPRFDHPLCGNATDRERLGLPAHYVPDRLAEGACRVAERLQPRATEVLLALCDSWDAPLLERVTAGNILALRGDPRITTLEPAMATVLAANVPIGLDEADIDTVMAAHGELGLDPRWLRKECPRHTVSLRSFRIARFLVTNQEYRDFLIDTRYPELPTCWTFRRFPRERANHPVYGISAADADAYAAWLAHKTGRMFRLPTEAEWEYAAGGPHGFEYPWGDEFDVTRTNTAESGIFDTTPVGVFPRGCSPFGLADMAGNVEEYVADTYAPYPGGCEVEDHLASTLGEYRVARGGSFARFRDLARTRRRHGPNPQSPTYAMGLRLAESIPAQADNE